MGIDDNAKASNPKKRESKPKGKVPVKTPVKKTRGVFDPYLKHVNSFFTSYFGIIFVGAFIGIVATFLQHEGNPGNMGFCMACFERDLAGALGLHSVGTLQYARPEILGIVLGAVTASFIFGEFRPRGGSAPMVRFILGFFAMIGALVFLGCPWRALLRLAGGDWNAIVGLVGLGAGVSIGSFFIYKGFNLGRAQKTHIANGLIFPGMVFVLLIMLLVDFKWEDGTNILRHSHKLPHAALGLSLGVALFVGVFAQRTRFCTIGGIRDAVLIRNFYLLLGVASLLGAAFFMNYFVYDQFNAGWDGQPAAHTDGYWNFMGMVLAGFAFVLAGGCPGRQLILSGEGDTDAATFVFGMIAGAAASHNFRLASNGLGVGDGGPTAVYIGLIICLVFALAFTGLKNLKG